MAVAPALTVAIPLLAAALLIGIGSRLPSWVMKAVAIAAAVATTVVQFVLLVQSWPHDVEHWFGGWTTQQGVAVGIVFTVNPLDACLACTVGVLMIAALAYSWRGAADAGHLFYVLMLAFLGGMSGFALSGDLFNMFVFFELMSVAGYALCGYRNTSSPVVQGALNFAVINSIGAFFILMGIALVYGRTGALNLAQIGAALDGQRPDGLVVVSFVLLLVGFLVKAGAVPFHFWLSDAYAVAAAPVGALYAGIMSDLGYHAIVRIYSHGYAGAFAGHQDAVRVLFVTVGVVTAVVGAVMCWLQADAKRQLAFLVISHGGIFFCGLGLLSASGVAGATLYVAADGMAKGALFLVVGYVIVRLGSSNEVWAAGLGRSRQHLLAGVTAALCGLCLAAFPGTGTWRSAALVVHAADVAGYAWLPPVLGLATAVCAGTALRMIARVFLGWGPDRDVMLSSESAEATESEPDADRPNVALLAPAVVLVLLGIGIGFAPTLVGRALHSAAGSLDFHGYLAAVLHGTPPAAPASLPRFVPHAGEWLYGVGTVLGAFVVAWAGLGRRPSRLPARRVPVLRWLIAAHSGAVGDYAIWLGLGAVALLTAGAVSLR